MREDVDMHEKTEVWYQILTHYDLISRISSDVTYNRRTDQNRIADAEE